MKNNQMQFHLQRVDVDLKNNTPAYYLLTQTEGDPTRTGHIHHLAQWPCSSYSPQKAVKRADRMVGEAIRRAESVSVRYTKDPRIEVAI